MFRRSLYWTAVLLALVSPARSESAYEEPFTTGKDWVEKMSEREKFMSLLPPALLFNEYDIHLRYSLPSYVLLIDRLLEKNPYLGSENVSNIFATTVYAVEPEQREALKTMEMNFLRGELETKPYHAPRLHITDLSKEVAA